MSIVDDYLLHTAATELEILAGTMDNGGADREWIPETVSDRMRGIATVIRNEAEKAVETRYECERTPEIHRRDSGEDAS